jgi:hypothetical protein
MAVGINSGLVDDNDILSNERVIDMSEIVGRLETDFTQFTTALMKVRSKAANSTKVEWLEDRLFPRLSALSATATSAASSIDVTASEGVYFNVGDLVRNTLTGEAYEVTGVTTDSVGVNRSIGTVAAASSATGGAQLVIIGNAAPQGADTPPAKVVERTAVYNYTQIFRRSYSFTRSLTQSSLYTGGEPNYERKKKGIEHKNDIEHGLFFGARDLDTTGQGGTEPVGFMGGLIEYLSTNLHDAGGALTATELDTFLQSDLQYGNQNKVIFASPTVARVISTFARDNWTRATPENKVWGVKVDGLVSGAFGYELPVFVKREWGTYSAASNGYGSRAFVVDMDKVRIRPLQKSVLLRNRQGNGQDRVTEEYLTETSFEIHNEAAHAMIYGVTA